MNNRQHFQFTLGPVQGFVAQARRTRDFWAGSFLLSWLVAVAMKAVKRQSGKIVFPCPNDDYLAWLEGEEQGERPPYQGVVPNRFKAEVGKGFDPARVVDSVRLAWWELAELVWRENLAHACATRPKSRTIWERQIQGFWEINWVLGEESNLMDRRKNWRIHLPKPEGGVKCTVMEGWQELSGEDRPDAKAPERFWGPIRKGGKLDLAEGEYLCAVAFVKRRFAGHFDKLHVPMPGGWTLKGWKLPTGVPSVVYLAAAHWLETIIQTRDEAELATFVEQAERLGESGEWASNIRCVSESWERNGHKPSARRLAGLDGGLFFESSLVNPRLYPDQALASGVTAQLRRLAGRDKPTPFYAILLMDGDSLGSHMSDADKQPKISRALERFTGRAGKIVEIHNGFLVYAGGDDVLAMLPLEDALACAAALRAEYLAAFAGTGIDSTLSGAIEYAHMKMPLTRVLRDAHTLLDEVAKDGRGRDAIAVRVWKPGGQALEWAMPWEKTLVDGQIEIQGLVDVFTGELAEFSSKFFYKIRERFDLLNPQEQHAKPILDDDQACSLLAADYLASGVNQGREPKLTVEEAKDRIRPLLAQCRPVIRDKDEALKDWKVSDRLEEDGALLVRFLARKGMEQ